MLVDEGNGGNLYFMFCLTCNCRVPDMQVFGNHQQQQHEVYLFPRLPRGWLRKQFDTAAKDVQELPDWLKGKPMTGNDPLILLREEAMENLKPCPFCGGPAYATRTVNGTQMFKVGCASCGIELKAAWYRDEIEPTKDIVKLWNTRAVR